MTIGESIRKAREDRGYSRQRLAIRSGVSYHAIQRWEQENSNPTVINLIPIADALGISLDELVGRRRNED